MLNSFQELYCDEITSQQLFPEPSLVISLERPSRLCRFKQSPSKMGLNLLHSAVFSFVCGFIHHSLKTAIVQFTKRSFVLDSLRLTSIPLFFLFVLLLLFLKWSCCNGAKTIPWLSSSFADRLYSISCNNIAPYKPVCMCKCAITYLWRNIALPHMRYLILSVIIAVFLACAGAVERPAPKYIYFCRTTDENKVPKQINKEWTWMGHCCIYRDRN